MLKVKRLYKTLLEQDCQRPRTV